MIVMSFLSQEKKNRCWGKVKIKFSVHKLFYMIVYRAWYTQERKGECMKMKSHYMHHRIYFEAPCHTTRNLLLSVSILRFIGPPCIASMLHKGEEKVNFGIWNLHFRHFGDNAHCVIMGRLVQNLHLLKGKFPQTTMWSGWVERNPTIKYWANLDNPLERTHYAKFCMLPYKDGTLPESVIPQDL